MATCPHCQATIADGAEACPKCGKKVIPGDELENVQTKTTGWQKFVIIVTIILLILVAITYQSAQDREDKAAQAVFTHPVAKIVSDVAVKTGISQYYGMPNHQLKADTKDAEVSIVFPRHGMSQQQAASVGQSVAAMLARTYVRKGYMPRHITVYVSSEESQGKPRPYGAAIYNGNMDALGWEPAAR